MERLEQLSLWVSIFSLTLNAALSFIETNKRAGSDGCAQRQFLQGLVLRWVKNIVKVAVIAALSMTILSRGLVTGRGPFSSMYEFAVAFAWGISVAVLFTQWRLKSAAINGLTSLIALLLVIFAVTQYQAPGPLMPALQQSWLLSFHVASAVVAYGTLTISFSAAVLYLIKNKHQSSWLPDNAVLEKLSYQAVMVGFPFLTILIVTGAFWADLTWGRYWGWDPKETASFVTWLVYAAYMHARVIRGWKGTGAALLLIIGFFAILITFFGNYVFNGLHSYR